MVQGGSAHNLGLARVHIEDASGGDRRSWPGRVVGPGRWHPSRTPAEAIGGAGQGASSGLGAGIHRGRRRRRSAELPRTLCPATRLPLACW